MAADRGTVITQREGRSTQNARILAALNDGQWHTCQNIHTTAGFSRLNSRIAELRTRGYTIQCRHVDGATHGPEAYEYRLTETPNVGTSGVGEPRGDGLSAPDTTQDDHPVAAVSSPTPDAAAAAPSVPTADPAGASTYQQLILVAA